MKLLFNWTVVDVLDFCFRVSPDYLVGCKRCSDILMHLGV